MRACVLKALVLGAIALAPVTSGQIPDVPLVELRAGEDPALVQPLQGAVTANLTLRVSCALTDERGSVPIAYEVATFPSWATVVVSPMSDVAHVQSCEGGYAERNAIVTMSATDAAPAFTPTAVTVRATAGAAARQESATATVNLTADYFFLVDIGLPEKLKTAPPGTEVGFTVSLVNLGNGRTRVRFELGDVSEGLTVLPPEAVVLESRQQGGVDHARDVVVRVMTAEGRGFVNRVDVVNLHVIGEHADEPPRAGLTDTVSMMVTTKTGAQAEDGSRTPVQVLLVALALGISAAAMPASWRRR